MAPARPRPRPVLTPEFCKGCGRCIEACAQGCIEPGTEIHPRSGLMPVVLDLERCTACGLCLDACPEPFGLAAQVEGTPTEGEPLPAPVEVPDVLVPLPAMPPRIVKGTYASAMGALLAGCRHFYGYPITPSTEGAELMAKMLPALSGSFLQAVSEVAAINMMYGTAAAGLRTMTFTSSPGFSLMLEGISYMIGAELPAVVVNVMRGGPGLGNIGPEQADIKLACRGLGHGNTQAIVLAPSTPQEMLDFTFDAFDLAFRYRNPVIVLADGYLGQMTGKVVLPRALVQPGLPAWAVWGDRAHRRNLVASILIAEADLEAFNRDLNAKYARMQAEQQRAALDRCEDAEVLLVATGTPARAALGAVEELRAAGVKAGLFRPQSLWPFPIDALRTLMPRLPRLVVVEASHGQLEDELRLALSHAGIQPPAIERVQRYGGVLPQVHEIVQSVRTLAPAPLG
ncbi:MAG TPA: 3-methyl-2-oxobutanoate dehydrogenase subunit VorB [Candidatus Polarisedimenticolaceae bacterium]|nr:3-methyl-2-oxobutanoate dehydrogenase subunit VorB [Candidatus Polarisedimenticolaceae bacterium]